MILGIVIFIQMKERSPFMIYRYEFQAFIGNDLIYHCFLKSLNQVARTYDYFTDDEVWFEIVDVVHNKSIEVNELMRIYHGEVSD